MFAQCQEHLMLPYSSADQKSITSRGCNFVNQLKSVNLKFNFYKLSRSSDETESCVGGLR